MEKMTLSHDENLREVMSCLLEWYRTRLVIASYLVAAKDLQEAAWHEKNQWPSSLSRATSTQALLLIQSIRRTMPLMEDMVI